MTKIKIVLETFYYGAFNVITEFSFFTKSFIIQNTK